MSFPLDYPLDGRPERDRQLFQHQILRIVPPWLRRTVGGALMSSIGIVMDAMVDMAADAVKLRFGDTDEAALAIAGRERGIVRGPSEDAPAYAARVQQWLPAHQHRGSAWELLRQWRAYNGQAAYDTNTGQQIDVVYKSGTAYRLNTTGEIERFIPGWGGNAPPGGWAQAWCFLYVDADPTPVSAADDASMAAIPRNWTAAHMLPLNVVVVWPGARLWAYPNADITWAAQEALYTWDDLPPHTVT